jgi:DNA-binding FrmR family transcriptional regulator
MYPSHKENLISLRRIEGQIRGIQKMIKTREYCIDILMQISAVEGALSKVKGKILHTHLQNCVCETMKSGSKSMKQKKINEILNIIQQTRRG